MWDSFLPRPVLRSQKQETAPCVVEIHKNAGGNFVQGAQSEMQFGRKIPQFAQIDAKGEKIVLNSWA